MNLSNLRQAVFDAADWASDATDEQTATADRLVNRAIAQVALDAPYLPFEGKFYIQTQPDEEPTLTTDTVFPIGEDTGLGFDSPNPWVFRVTLPPGTADAVEWKTDRTWDSRYIEITDDSGVKRTNRIRAVWVENDTGTDHIRFSLWRPWNVEQWGEGPFATWRIYTNEYVLPDEVVELKSMRTLHVDQPFPIQLILQGDAEDAGLAEHTTNVTSSTSAPIQAYRRWHEQINGPKVAPIVAAGAASGTKWQGPDPAGTFRYIVTYCWGKRPYDYSNPGPGSFFGSADVHPSDFDTGAFNTLDPGEQRIMEPIYESAPSPASDEVEALVSGDNTGVITVSVPLVDYALGFDMTGTGFIDGSSQAFARQHSFKSGWYVRIYRQRVDAQISDAYFALGVDSSPGGQTVSSVAQNTNLDFDDGYYLLAELKINPINNGQFLDRGMIVPDNHRRLRDIHGYQSVKFNPRPQDTYEIEIRASKRPKELVSDYDVPGVAPEACDLVVYKALEYLYERLKDGFKKADARNEYMRLLGQHAKRYGMGTSSSVPHRRRAARRRL